MTIEIIGIDKLTADIQKTAKNIPYALSLTLNDLGYESMGALNKDVSAKLKVKSVTGKAFTYKKSSKNNLETIIEMKHDWHRIALRHHYIGGTTSYAIKFEQMIVERGYMNKANSAIPVKKITRAGYTKATAALSRGGTMFAAAVGSSDRRVAHLKSGVYERTNKGNKIRPLFVFTSEASYKKRLDVDPIVERVVRERVNVLFKKNLDKALA